MKIRKETEIIAEIRNDNKNLVGNYFKEYLEIMKIYSKARVIVNVKNNFGTS